MRVTVSCILPLLCSVHFAFAQTPTPPVPTDDSKYTITPSVFHSGFTNVTDSVGINGQAVTIMANLGQNIIMFSGDQSNDSSFQGFWYMWGRTVLPPETLFVSQDTLFPGFPNPFNPATTIPYFISATEHGTHSVNVHIYLTTILGQDIITLYDGKQLAGKYYLPFDGRSAKLGSGAYICAIVLDDNQASPPIHEELTIKLLYMR